jgi:RNA-directed DNA polymerase
MRQEVRRWHLQLKCDKSLSDLSNMFNPVLRGWAGYYGRFYPSAMRPLWRHVNDYLVRWLRRKHKRMEKHVLRAVRALERLAASDPGAFVHWGLGALPKA